MRVPVYANTSSVTAATSSSSTNKLASTAPTLSESSTKLTTMGTATDLSPSVSTTKLPLAPAETRRDEEIHDIQWVDMSNGIVVTVLGWAMWLFITAMNIYLIVQLGLGNN